MKRRRGIISGIGNNRKPTGLLIVLVYFRQPG
jgi:hypothetical protein